jgi:hypothetical protein
MGHVQGVTVCVYVAKDRFEVLKAEVLSNKVAAFEMSHCVVYWKITLDSEIIFCNVES